MRILRTSSENTYYYDEYTRKFGLVHPVVQALNTHNNIKEFDPDVLDYHRKKINYWLNNNYISATDVDIEYKKIQAADIMREFINTNQIVLEVTNHCNMECTYCGYGKLYNNYDDRNNANMDFHIFEILFEYLRRYWNTEYNLYSRQNIFISFYGGEPLINFRFIKQVVEYLNTNPVYNKKFIYSMTTNALLLDKYMDFMVKNKFRLLISLDGDEKGNSYRQLSNGTSTFFKVTDNIHLLKKRYPDYFTKYVDFNSVIHNKNSVIETVSYIQKKYNKLPSISELNTNGVNPDNKKVFNQIFKDADFDFQKNNILNSISDVFLQSPNYQNASDIIYRLSSNVFNASYSQILRGNNMTKKQWKFPTGTCIPFSRKIFISAKGFLYPCERIGNEFYFGRITNCLNINYQFIADMFNKLLAKYETKCSRCGEKLNCQKCVIAEPKAYQSCPVLNNEGITYDISSALSLLESQPEIYSNIVLKTVIA